MTGSLNKANTLRPLIQRLNSECSKFLSDAADMAYKKHHEQLTIFHLGLIIAESDNISIRNELGLNEEQRIGLIGGLTTLLNSFISVQGITPIFSEKLIILLKDSLVTASLKLSKNPVIDVSTIITHLYGLSDFEEFVRKRVPDIYKAVRIRRDTLSSTRSATEEMSSADLIMSDLPNLSRFTEDLSLKAKEGKIDPVVGRYNEVENVVEVLIRRRQNNPILVGEAGVGKTAIIEALAIKIAEGNVPDQLKNANIRILDIGMLKAGASQKGELESRLKSIMLEISTSTQAIILFVDEIHAFMGSASASDTMDIANLIKPELSRGKFRIIGATTWSEYKKFIEKDPALVRRFQLIKVDEPSDEETLDILTAIAPTLEVHHSVQICYEAMRSAIDYSIRYLPSRQLPDKAISLLDTACSKRGSEKSAQISKIKHIEEQIKLVHKRCLKIEEDKSNGFRNYDDDLYLFRNQIESLEAQLQLLTDNNINDNTLVSQIDVASVISNWTGVPVEQVCSAQSERIKLIESNLRNRIVGQYDSIRQIVDKLRTYSAGISSANKPIGVFMITGPTGVGKTETALAISDIFFGKDSVTCINMSEYQEPHTVSKLKGAPAGYVGYGQGGVLTEAIRRKPFGLLLLDEFEKAHSDVHNLFMQIFDKGYIEDAEGLLIDFTSTLIILTSNAGFDFDPRIKKIKKNGDYSYSSLNEYFSQALLARIEVIEFKSLELDELVELTKRKTNKLIERYHNVHKKTLVIDDELCLHIAELAYNNPEGGRIIERLINIKIERLVSEIILDYMEKNIKLPNLIVSFDGSDVGLKVVINN